MFFYTTKLIFASVASGVLVSEALIRVADAVKRRWTSPPVRLDADKTDAPTGRPESTPGASNRCSDLRKAQLNSSSLDAVDKPIPREVKATKICLRSTLPTHREITNTTQPRSNNKANFSKVVFHNTNIKRPEVGKPKALNNPKSVQLAKSVPRTQVTKVQANSQLPAQTSTQGSAQLATSAPQASPTNIPNGGNVQGNAHGQSSENSNVPGSSSYIVPFPDTTSYPLRASQSAPARIPRTTKPPRVVPAKRPVKAQQNEVEATHAKRRRLYHPYGPSVQAVATPPRGSVAGLSIPSPLTSPKSPPIAQSDSVMSLSKLTGGHPPKRVCTTPAIRHEPSSSGQPGALAHVPSLEAKSTGNEDVDMAVLDAMETPDATMSSPDPGDWDEWMHSVPSTPCLDDEMRSPLDEDVNMEEACGYIDGVMWEVDKEDVDMRDWTDQDVVMEEVT